jgi:predicted CoA-binding protein
MSPEAQDVDVRQILQDAKTIAVVGLSPRPDRDSNSVARYMQAAGYRIIPVNPTEDRVLGEKSYASLRDVPESVDIVDVFRRAEHTPPVAEEAVAIGAKVLWLQLGIRSEESRRIAQEGGLPYIEDSCIRTVHQVTLG